MLFPGAIWRPVPSHGGPMSAHLGLILHVQEGDNSCYGEFSNPANKASSTWWVSKKGLIEQYVDADYVAWAQKAGNATYNSVETEGFVEQALTSAQMDALARLFSWGRGVYGWRHLMAEKPGQRGLGYHGMGGDDWGHPNCPGFKRKAQRADVLARETIVSAKPGGYPPKFGVTTTDVGDLHVQRIDFSNTRLGEDGNGWVWCDAPHDKIIAIRHQGSYPPDDGYWLVPRYASQARVTDGHQSVIEIQGGTPHQMVNFSVWVGT